MGNRDEGRVSVSTAATTVVILAASLAALVGVSVYVAGVWLGVW